ncbi:RidA family protein [Paenibacillus sp. 7523-1]|uniref:RidA family protein n=1 Tax=Paenibacillus sp. 7523-1 TaxID=2022550 RepID=UPI000BA5E040|nr:RidA family protein [Paenibacillus sp. 7523-1]PAD28288.1 hypothetical protein CHH60_27085 [Paenibacillus sp. 7523-1]
MNGIERIQPNDFSKAIGAYSHGIKLPLPGVDLIFLTGQIAMDSEGNAIASDSPKHQTEFIFENIKKLLREADAEIANVIKVTIYVTDMNYFSQVSEVRNKFLSECKPVSTLVEVNRLAKDGCDVEIEVIAAVTK